MVCSMQRERASQKERRKNVRDRDREKKRTAYQTQ